MGALCGMMWDNLGLIFGCEWCGKKSTIFLTDVFLRGMMGSLEVMR